MDTKLQVLVVDDHFSQANSLADLIKSYGHEVHVCYDGEGGLALASARHFDLALVDLVMPEVDGFATAEQIRTRLSIPKDLVLVAVTGYADASYKSLAERAGFNGYLLKPIEEEKLREVLEQVRKRKEETHLREVRV